MNIWIKFHSHQSNKSGPIYSYNIIGIFSNNVQSVKNGSMRNPNFQVSFAEQIKSIEISQDKSRETLYIENIYNHY